MLRTFVVVSMSLLAAACGGPEVMPDAGPPPLYPADYASYYQEVRNCRFSLDHDLERIRVVVPPDVVAAYTSRAAPFAPGTLVVKEVYDGGDLNCTGPVKSIAVIQKLEAGAGPDSLDWDWQKVDVKTYTNITEDRKRCIQCHTDCGKSPEGFDGTCAVP